MAAALVMAGIGAGLQGLSLINSYFDKKAAEKEAARLSGLPIPEYTISPDMLEQKRIANQMFSTPQGYTQPEIARFRRGIGTTLATQNYNATNVGGGGVARAIGAIGNANTVNAETDFAASDAGLARQNRNMGLNKLYDIAKTTQTLQNMNTQNEYSRRLMAMQAAGAAIRSNKDFINGTLMNVGQDLLGAGLTQGLMPTSFGSEPDMDVNLRRGIRTRPFRGVNLDYNQFPTLDYNQLES